ncbi:uncharacterized protein LOC141601787 [Silene latifolia]|uniref:uncharacterized protein LOC141601787 n=1 Tax=Silene latifolia TaxID=37657 RepID=UPI003D774A3E
MVYIVGPEQAAFVRDKSLFENVMLTQSLVKGYTRRNITPRCMLKVDISKAFDILQWNFIQEMLLELKFPPMFIKWGVLPSIQQAVDILNVFSEWSGLKANMEKTEAYLGGVDNRVKDLILATVGIQEGVFPFRYLGLPINPSKLIRNIWLWCFDHNKAAIWTIWVRKYITMNCTIWDLEIKEKQPECLRDSCATQNKFSISKAYEQIRRKYPVQPVFKAI